MSTPTNPHIPQSRNDPRRESPAAEPKPEKPIQHPDAKSKKQLDHLFNKIEKEKPPGPHR